MTELRTARLVLRQWRESDYTPFAALNADREVMRYFPVPITSCDSIHSPRRLTRTNRAGG
jgi:RimJ/RimL family protein N-acetyltransferase